MRRELDRPAMLALAALYAATERAGDGPIDHQLELRAVLWLLYQRSNREREPYASFWRTMTEAGRETQAAYIRGTYARMHWCGIVRTLGASPEPMTFHTAIAELVRQHCPPRRGGGAEPMQR